MKKIVLLILTLILTLAAEEPAFRFAWLSDTHIGSSGAAADLRQAVADVNTKKVDFTIISGDITELDIGSYLDTAKQILDQLEHPYYIIPGNHDTKWSASGGQKFATLWGDDKFQYEIGDFRFIGIHQGPLLRMGDGFIVPEDLTWLDSLLVNLPDPNQKLIFITHYGLNNSVSNWYKYLDTIKRHNAQMILHGHGHSNKVHDYEGVAGIMGRSTLTRGENPGGYNIVSVWPDSARFSEQISSDESLPAWHVQHFENHTYPDTTEFERPDFSGNDDYPNVQVQWEFDTGFAIASAPALTGQITIITDGNGSVTALDVETGALQWKESLAGPIYSTPAVTPEYVVVSSTDSTIYCLSVKNGQSLWQVKTKAPLVASPVIENGIVYCGSSDGIFRALNLENGQSIWEYSGVEGFVETIPLVHKKKIIFGAWDGNLYALSAKTGQLKWIWNDGRKGVLYSPAACQPVASGNKIFIVAPDRVMSCINARNGKTIWREDRYPVRESIGISEDFKTIFAKTMWDTVVAYSAHPRKSTLKWAVHAGYGYDIDPSTPVEKGGTLFFGTKDGYVYALSAASGDLLWRYRIGVGLVNNVTPLSATAVIATAMDGKVIRLESQSVPIQDVKLPGNQSSTDDFNDNTD